jgi:AmmeMemoRadiSam system protein A
VVGYGSWLFREPDPDAILLGVARNAVAADREPEIDPDDYPAALAERRSSFVTLRLDGELRGCIGSLVAELPLVQDVSRSAFRAAHRDPRFEPVREDEIEQLEVHVSILDPSEPLLVASEADLLVRLRPGVDGLVLAEGDRRATFLPDVWEALPDPRDFVARLKEKAGLDARHWSPRIRVSRYTTRTIS